jgi:hypothetical protein
VDHDPAIIWIVVPDDTEPEPSEEAEDVNYMMDNDYYPQSPGLQQVFVPPEPSPPPSPSFRLDSVEKDLEALPENVQAYFLLGFHLDRPEEKEDRVTQLTTAAAEHRREKLYGLPLLPSLSRPGRMNKRDRWGRPTQGDWVLIREVAPNQPNIAHRVSSHTSNSDSESEPDQSVIESDHSVEAELSLLLCGSTASFQAAPSMFSPSTGRGSVHSPLQPLPHRQHILGTPSLCSLERLLELSRPPLQDLEDTTSLVVDWDNFDPAGFDRHSQADPSLIGLGDWLADNTLDTSVESNSNVLEGSFDDVLSWLFDNEAEFANQFRLATDEPVLRIANQGNGEILLATWENDIAGHTCPNVTSSLVENDPVDDWTWSDDSVGDWIQPTVPNGFLQRHLFRQSLFDQRPPIAQSTLEAYLNSSIIIPKTIDLSQCPEFSDSTLPLRFDQESRENTSEEVVISAPVGTCLKRHNTDEAEESLGVSIPAKRIRQSESNTQTRLKDGSSTLLALGSLTSHTGSDTAVPIEESIAPSATTISGPLSTITQTFSQRPDSPSVHVCPDCLKYFDTAGLLA